MTELWVQRTGPRRYVGESSRGATVQIGSEDVEGVFTPGELLKIALAACSGMASDVTLARRLGDDYDATIRVSGTADRESETYPVLDEIFELDLSELDAEAAQRLLVVAQRFAVLGLVLLAEVTTAGFTTMQGVDAHQFAQLEEVVDHFLRHVALQRLQPHHQQRELRPWIP